MKRIRPFVWLTSVAAVALVVAAPAPVGPGPAAAQSAANPDVAEQCGLPVTIVLDASGSIQSAGAVELVRDAAEVFLEALRGTGSTARVVDFGTFSRQTAPADLVTAQSMAPGGVHGDAIAAYYNPRTPLTPPATAARQYNGSGSLTSTGSFGSVNNDTQWTNWDSALDRANDVASDLIVFVTDGDPTAINLDQPGDAFNPPGTTVAFNTFRGQGTGPSVSRAVAESNEAKAAGTRMLAVAVGAAVTQQASLDRLIQIAGPQVVSDTSTVESINDVDVAVVPDFEDLADMLRLVVTELCTPSLALRKFVQTADSATYVPGEDWDITVTPTVDGGTFEWVLPNTAPGASKTVATSSLGFAGFQWEPDPSDASSIALVEEDVQDGFTPGEASCRALHPDGSSTISLFPSAGSFEVALGPRDIGTCELFNNFDYEPGIELVKEADPTLIRGDDGGEEVTYTFTVSNTGNTPLVLSEGDDSDCHEIEFVGGDDNDDGKLDVDEEWTYECTRTIQAGLTQDEIIVDNTAFVIGVDPEGTQVEDDDDAEVEVLVPAINLEKEASETLVAPGTEVTYTFTVTNLGNDPLGDITLTDDQCGDPTFVDGDTNGDEILDLDETWTYTCTAVIEEDPTINTANVTGTPTLGPDVEDPANAEVDIIFNDLQLTKSASAPVVFPGDEVTYTYEVTNPGEETLTPGPGLTREDMVTDDTCAPVTFVGGDDGDDSVMQPGGVETWTYECTTTLDVTTINNAETTMQGEIGGVITRPDNDIVLVVPTGINIVKTPSDDLIPAGSEVTYTYEVTNTGLAPLADVTVTDDTCDPVTFVEGDTDGDGMLGPLELWIYTCTIALDETTTNTATATGVPTIDGLTDEPVEDEDDATVDVYTSDIDLTKEASEEVVPVGTAVTYTFVATNTGDIELVPLGITDDNCAPLEFIGGDPEGDGRMAPGEAWTWECTSSMVADTTNTAVIEAVDPDGGVVTDDAEDTVEVFASEIVLEKTADPLLVPVGADSTFTLTVTNPSLVPLSDITITDSVCSSVEFVGGDTNGDDVLQPTETWTYTCTVPINETTVNEAQVTGTDPGGGQPTDNSFAGAIPYTAGIEVVKTADPTEIEAGEPVTYTYEVTNTGNVPLAEVAERIVDDTCAPVTYVEGDLNENGLLDPTVDAPLFEYTSEAETWLFTCTVTVSVTTTNVVTVTGTPSLPDGTPIGPDVTADDDATVSLTELPATGVPLAPLGIAALLVMAIGIVLVMVGARRRRT